MHKNITFYITLHTYRWKKAYKCITIHMFLYSLIKKQQSVCVKLLNRFQAPSEQAKKKVQKKLVIQDFYYYFIYL